MEGVIRGQFPAWRLRATGPGESGATWMRGPEEETGGEGSLVDALGRERAVGSSVSLYPTGQGLPVADHYCAALAGPQGELVFALADGCGWGHRFRSAATAAAEGLTRHLLDSIHTVKRPPLSSPSNFSLFSSMLLV